MPRILPWLLAAAAFVVYWLTLNHWVSLFNLGVVAKTSGWSWQPEFLTPLFFLVTYPFRWLPVAQIPIALNLFSAVCAALTLGLLARSVAILPQDRTDAQRERERSDFSFLTIWSAWLPPFLAVAVCGLQLTFWEQATNCTGEMFELLLFAFIVWSLMEYRLDEREWRLFLAAAVLGAGITDNWTIQSPNGSALIGFLPLFVAAVIWTRKLRFFNLRFLKRMVLCGLAGMLFYFLLPVLAVISHKVPVTFWQALKLNLAGQWQVVKMFFIQPEVRKTVLLLSLTSLVPVLLLSIRWKSSFGDNSKVGLALTSFMFHMVQALILGACIWIAFDPPFSPRHLGLGLPFLTFYYLAALGVGYFCGYFLLVFGKEAPSNRSRELRPSPLNVLNGPVVCGVWLMAILAVAGLVYKNAPQIRETNGDTFKKYAALVEENLPQTGGILLSDDPHRLVLVQSALASDGRSADFVPLDTGSLTFPAYHKFLHDRFPQRWPDTVNAAEQTNGVSPLHLMGLLSMLSKTNELYYLHPSFGYYFELFYAEPHGLVYKLKTLPTDTLLPPLPDKDQFAANENFWAHAEKTAFDPIIPDATPVENRPKSAVEKIFARLHIEHEPNQSAIVAGTFYSRSLDFWGVQLQRAGDLTNAAAHFETALKLNPDNVVAQVNLEFNRSLQAGQTMPIDLTKTTSDQFGKYHSWSAMINENGPFDEPSFCFENGVILVKGGLLRQAAEPFERVRQLVPDNLAARFWLAQIYLASRLPDRALDALREPLAQPENNLAAETNSTQLHVLAAAAYFQKDDNARGVQLLETEISRHPTNDDLLITTAQAYIRRGLFTNAIVVIDRKLQDTPDDPVWLFAKGYTSIQLKAYNDAIAAFTHLLTIQTTNSNALFNRAVAYLQSGKLDAARADYEKLSQTFTNSPRIAYGLGEIAWRKHETNETIRNYETYLATANTNTAEATNIIERLKSLQH
ncbi:MAG TPA: tetratricopeptide repeat protein [Verrucomicrobiae bacterium]|nr:tetratricopeptide repeat protein [Verrucomicrobiae bacterium]